ncbi:MAG: hypothetical protein WBW33_19220 [Bryobacteraceae bacterium]
MMKNRVAPSKESPRPALRVVVPPQVPDAAQANNLDSAHAINVEEKQSGYTVIMGLHGVDPRTVSVLARATSLLIEVSVNEVFRHPLVKDLALEIVHQNVSREVRFPTEIERGCTVIQIRGAFLEIIALKAKSVQDAHWSDLVHFDSRSSRGCM